MNKIYIVDVSSMFFRAFYAIRPLSSKNGTPVNAVYGFISMIVKLLKEKSPDHIVFCYDRKEPSFRKDLYEAYKANRSEMPEDLQLQMPYLKQVAQLFGITDLEVPGYEADDLIGTVARMAEKENFEAYIVSGDKDFCQLVSPRVFIYDTMKELVFDSQLVKEKHGVTPEQFIDYLSLVGDASDNIPGVAGIGPKGAQKLIEQFANLENIYEKLDEIKTASLKQKLIDSKEKAFLSKKLVSIVCDVPLEKGISDFKLQAMKKEELRSFLQELNFKSFEKSLLADESTQMVISNPASGAIPFVIDKPILEDQSINIDHLEKFPVQYHEWSAEKVQMRIHQKEDFFVYLENSQIIFGFKYDVYKTDLSNCRLDFSNVVWNGFDLKKVWTELGLNSKSQNQIRLAWDLMLGAYVLKASDCTDLNKLISYFLKQDISDKSENQDLTLFDNTIEDQDSILKKYNLILHLNQVVKKELEQKDLLFIYEKLEKPIIPILFNMEQNGIKIDLLFLKNFSLELASELASQEQKIHEMAQEKFNIASPKQLGVILFEKMGLVGTKKTKSGFSTDNDVLEKLEHPIANEIIHYREVAKLKSTYVDSLPEMADSSARVHTHFNQALTATGRFSSTNPNLQNIPIKTEKGQKVRKAFIAETGKKLLSVDYSQIELRVLAHMANDAGLIKAFQEDLDIHAATAAEIFNIEVLNVSKEQRRIAKAVNFGIAYGQGVFGLAETLGIPRREASDIIEKYFLKFSGIKDYIESTIQLAHEKKYVETLFGRRRYIPELDNKNVMIKKFGERAAINAPIQGTASDLVKMAMIDLNKYFGMNSEIKMLLQVHDELIFESTEQEIQKHLSQIVQIMQQVTVLKVPLKVNFAIGNNWDEAH